MSVRLPTDYAVRPDRQRIDASIRCVADGGLLVHRLRASDDLMSADQPAEDLDWFASWAVGRRGIGNEFGANTTPQPPSPMGQSGRGAQPVQSISNTSSKER